MAYSPMLSTMERSRRSFSRRASCAARCSVASRIKLTTAGPSAVSHRLEHDVDGDFRAVFAQAEEIHGRAHLPRAGMRAVIFAMAGMDAAEARRYQHFYRLADQLLARVTEQLLGARIGGAHHAVSVGDEDCVRRELKEPLDCVLGKTRMHAFLRTRVLPWGIRRAHFVLPTLAERYRRGPPLCNADAKNCCEMRLIEARQAQEGLACSAR